ncbi:MAG: flavodoxin domain-containing protein [Thermodesulfobacteriota bacterium]
MPRALIVYVTRSGQTQSIAQYIAEGIRFAGCDAVLMNAAQIQKEDQLEGYDAYVFGSPTYHGDMVPGMKNLLFIASKANLAGKVGGAFGAFGWSGEAVDRIYDTMQNIFQMNMVGAPLRLKSASMQGGAQMAQDYGRELGKRMTGT